METNLSGLQALRTYRQNRADLFRSDGSLQWFLRKHKQQLVEAGALLLHCGQWYVDPARFEGYVRQAGATAARRQLAPA